MPKKWSHAGSQIHCDLFPNAVSTAGGRRPISITFICNLTFRTGFPAWVPIPKAQTSKGVCPVERQLTITAAPHLPLQPNQGLTYLSAAADSTRGQLGLSREVLQEGEAGPQTQLAFFQASAQMSPPQRALPSPPHAARCPGPATLYHLRLLCFPFRVIITTLQYIR